MEFFELIRAIVAEQLGAPIAMLELDTKLTDYNADELDLIDIIELIEEMFEIEFANEQEHLSWSCIRNILVSVQVQKTIQTSTR